MADKVTHFFRREITIFIMVKSGRPITYCFTIKPEAYEKDAHFYQSSFSCKSGNCNLTDCIHDDAKSKELIEKVDRPTNWLVVI